MNVTEFRSALSAFSGPELFRRFLQATNCGARWRGRFLFWQEELLERFAAYSSIADVTFQRIEPLLRICELHEAELRQDLEALSQRCRGAVTEYTMAKAERFPNTDSGPVVMGRPRDHFRTGLWYCPACRAAEKAWGGATVTIPGFLAALGEEFCQALSPPVPDDLIVPQDGYEVWRRAFETDPTPESLATLTEDGGERLRAVCAEYFECPSVSVGQVRLAVVRTLARWPVTSIAPDTPD